MIIVKSLTVHLTLKSNDERNILEESEGFSGAPEKTVQVRDILISCMISFFLKDCYECANFLFHLIFNMWNG